MRKTKLNCGFFVSLLINIILNAEWSIPAWILLILHFTIGIPLVWFWIALAAWLLIVTVWMLAFGYITSADIDPTAKQQVKIVERKNDNPVTGYRSENMWICACGEKNGGKFCSECGKPRSDSSHVN